ncbi:MAG: hypothetical protein ACE5IJ_01665 [Thermoplasmata archaeon]
MKNEDISQLIRQNEVIVSLLGRLSFKPEEIREIVAAGKKNPEKYIEGYNACDGTRTQTDISKVIGVSQGTLSPIIREWEEIGIVYQVARPKGSFYKKLYPI